MDIDWEGDSDSSNFSKLLTTLRDTLNTWSPHGVLTATGYCAGWSAVWGQYGGWYNVPVITQKVDYFFPMDYLMAYVLYSGCTFRWQCDFDAPFEYPTTAPYDAICYLGSSIKESHRDWLSKGFDSTKIGIGLSVYAIPFNNTTTGNSLGSEAAGYTGVSAYVPPSDWGSISSKTYHAQADSWWGYYGGNFTTYTDSAGAYNRIRWECDSVKSKVAMLYDFFYGRIGSRQPHLDAMVLAMKDSYIAQGGEPPAATTKIFIKQ
jgi:hypothetical protein